MTQPAPRIPVLRRRLRELTYLAIATGVAVLLAIVAVWLRAASVEPAFKHVLLFPHLAEKSNDVATILVESKGSAFSVTRDADGRWVLPGKFGYPADFNLVRKTILALGELEAVDRRTARSDWYERLGLGAPKTGGSGVVITLKDSQGTVLADLITGQTVEGAAAGGNTALYARRSDNPQTYVVLGSYTAQPDQTQWLDKAFIELPRDRVKTVEVKPLKSPPFSVTRAKPDDQNFVVGEPLPRGRVLRTEAEPNGVGNALLGISFEDVVKANTLDFSNAAHTTYKTFDGLTLSVSAIEKDRDFWITVTATATPQPAPAPPTPPAPGTPAPQSSQKPDVAKEAAAINALASGWAYKIPRYKGVLITAKLEDLLKPIGGPPPGPSATEP
ncbi:MAG: DUF4340 domain-containing protein [Alphaproteobacteria bacterium]|nr:DUF4340 domain-containing protein [Alphaproteobacteria bacterium]